MNYEVIGDSAARAEWLALRNSGIGASEMPAIMGLSTWESAVHVYARKVGAIPVDDDEPSEAAYWGTTLERLVAARWSQKTGIPHQWCGELARSIEHPWALATLDARVPNARSSAVESTPTPLECKTANQHKASDWAAGAPEAYRVQAHQQMLVTGADECFVACLIGGQTFVWDTVTRDEALMRRIVMAGARFWQCVQDRSPPLPDGSDSSIAALDALYPTHFGDVDLDADMLAVDEVRQDAIGRIKALEDIRDRANAALRAAIAGGKRGRLPTGVSYTLSTVNKSEYVVKATSYTQLRRTAPKDV